MLRDTKSANCSLFSITSGLVSEDYSTIPHFSKSFETFFESNLLHAAITCARKRGGIREGARSS